MSINENAVQGIAGADLTGSQFLFVYVDGSDSERLKVSGDAGSATVLGVLINAPADEGVAQVVTEGFATAIAAETLEPFDYLTTNAAGKCRVVDTTGDYYLAQYCPPLENGAYRDAAAGDQIRVRILSNKLTQSA